MSSSSSSDTPDRPRRETDTVASGWLTYSNSIFTDAPPKRAQRAAGATAGSIAVHALLVLFVAWLVMTDQSQPEPLQDPRPVSTLVYLQQPGPGGGGGGSPAPAPPRPVEIPRSKPPVPVPVVTPPPPVRTPPPPPTLSAAVMTMNATTPQASGANLSAPPAAAGGGGVGTGLGEGRGNGVGPGSGGNTGGGAMRLGAGINNPVVLREIKPIYTSDAMRAKIQGSVELEAVVERDGTIGDIRVTKSLDAIHGLDQEAIKAARRWVFKPATDRQGQPVAVWVTLVLDFRIH